MFVFFFCTPSSPVCHLIPLFRVIRHVDVNYINENHTDKLRIHIYKIDDLKTPIGKKDVPLTLIANKFSSDGGQLNTSFSSNVNSLNPIANSKQHNGSNLNSSHASQGLNSLTFLSKKNRRCILLKMSGNIENVNYLVIIVGIVCLGFLFLPVIGDTQSSLPKYLQISFEMKLLAAYILGMMLSYMLMKGELLNQAYKKSKLFLLNPNTANFQCKLSVKCNYSLRYYSLKDIEMFVLMTAFFQIANNFYLQKRLRFK